MQITPSKVSIIILSYNQAEYISDAINSALNQTYKNLEIIISDNGSTDETKDLIKSFLFDPRVIFLDYEDNKSISLRQNQAAKRVSGDFISLLYADDYYLPTKIENQIKLFSGLSEKWGVVHGPGFQLIERTGELLPLNATKAQGDCLKDLFHDYEDGFIIPISPLVRTKAYLEFPLYEDMFSEGESLYWRIATKYRFCYCDIPLVVMRYHEKNMGKAIKRNMDMHLQCLDRLILHEDFPKDAFKFYKQYRAKIVFSNSWHCLRTNFEITWAKKLLLSSLISSPKSLLKLKCVVIMLYALLPQKLIFYINKLADFILKKKLFVPLKDYYN